MQNNDAGYINAGFQAPSVRTLVPVTTLPPVPTRELSGGEIAGIVVGAAIAAVLLAIIVIMVIYCW